MPSIGVAVDDGGVVTLTGHVPNYLQRLFVEDAVRRVRGVCVVAQEIEVRYPSDPKTSDDEIAKRALDALRWDATVPDEKIKLTVKKGVVTLTGEVPWQYERSAAESALRRLFGVTGVVNSIIIKPKVQAANVKRKIEDALKRYAEVEAQAIRVNVINDKVTVVGKVDSWDERRAVEHAAWSAPGVRFVEDHLTIGR